MTDTILTAVAAGISSKNVPMIKDSMELLGIENTGAGQSHMNQAMIMRKNLKVAKSTPRSAKWVFLLKRQWKGHPKVTT